MQRKLAVIATGLLIPLLVFAAAWPARDHEAAAANLSRQGHTATLLEDGTVLVVGGRSGGSLVTRSGIVISDSQSFAGPESIYPRSAHTATLLPDGRVLVAGGRNDALALDATELFDPSTGAFSLGPRMGSARSGHTAVTLATGDILLLGGDAGGTVEVFEQKTNSFRALSIAMAAARQNHSSIVLGDGRVLSVGGTDGNGRALKSAEVLDPRTGKSIAIGDMKSARSLPKLHLLRDGKVQVIGGNGSKVTLEMFNTAGYFTAEVNLPKKLQSDSGLVSASSAAPVCDGCSPASIGRGRATRTGASDTNSRTMSVVALEEAATAWVTTDKTDYPPGEVVTITGGGYAPGETVNLVITRSPETAEERQMTFTSVADGNGSFVNRDFMTIEEDLFTSFLVVATGATSGRQAFTSFTDGPKVESVKLGAQNPNPVTAGSGNTATYDLTVTRGSGNDEFSASVTVAFSNLPAGTSVPFSPATITIDTTSTQQTKVLTLSPSAALPAGTYDFTVTVARTNNNKDSASASGTLVVANACAKPSVATLASLTITYGAANAKFEAEASGSPAPTVQWEVSTDGGANWNNVSGATATTLNIAAPTVAQSGTKYRATFTNSCGTATTNPATLTVSKALATVNLSGLSHTYDGTAKAASASTTPSGLTVNISYSQGGSPVSAPTNAGAYDVSARINDGNYEGSTTGTLQIAKANATISVTGYTGVYDGAAHGATGTATGVVGETLTSELTLGASFTDVPGGTANWSFAGNTNYNSAIGSAAILISKANATISVTGYTGVYDGAAHGASGTATGVSGESLSSLLNLGASFTDAPGGTANWSFAGNTNYNSAIGSAAIVISKADATINVSGYTGVYDGAAHGAIGTATGVGGESLSSLLNLGASFTDAPGGTANWSFAGNTNYNPAIGSAAIMISKADATINVSGYTGVYDGAAHGARGTATGVSGESLSSLLNLGASFTDAPGGTANWSFAGNTNYNSAIGSAAIVISKADATINVSGYTGVYDGAAHGAIGTATGVGGESLSSLINLGASFTDAPGGTANWSFAGNTNYNSAIGSAAILISKANATISVNGYTGVYDGAAHGATGTATGVKGENLSSLLTLGASFTNVPGGIATWNFAGNTNHKAASGTAAITINPLTITVKAVANAKYYGGLDPTLTYTFTPALVGTDQFSGTLTRAAGNGVGTYAIQQGTLALSTNYIITFVGATFTIVNIAPTLSPINGLTSDPTSVGASGYTVNVNATLTDPGWGGAEDVHSYRWTWDDGTPDTVGQAEPRTSASDTKLLSVSHTFATAGVYRVTLTVTDGAGATATTVFEYLVLYNPNGGFVTGGGWINSPAGAYVANPAMSGKATFGFVSKYQKGANVPTGETQFQLHAANFTFNSTSYQWLVVSGAKAQFKGSGKINGAGDYSFLLTATDGQVNGGGGTDKFRIKIMDRLGGVVYDNVPTGSDDIDGANPQALGGGSIVVHSK